MQPCDKRQKIVGRDRYGNKTERFRCLNNQCAKSGQIIDENVCNICPVAVILKKEPPCKKLKESPLTAKTKDFIDVTDEEIKQILEEGGLDSSDVDYGPEGKDYPPLQMQLWAYKEAVLRWVKAGRPTRTDEEVKQIHDQYCVPCEWYDAKNKRCRGCGCKVTVSSFALGNKIKMATEHCPKEKW